MRLFGDKALRFIAKDSGKKYMIYWQSARYNESDHKKRDVLFDFFHFRAICRVLGVVLEDERDELKSYDCDDRSL